MYIADSRTRDEGWSKTRVLQRTKPVTRWLFVWAVLSLIGACAPAEDQEGQGFSGITTDLPTGHAAIREQGLVAAYDMSSLTAEGLLWDFGPNVLHGRVDAPDARDGVFGGALSFSDVTGRVQLPANVAFDLDGPLTIAVWLRMDSGEHHQHIVACDDKWALWITSDDRYRLGDTRGGGWSTEPGTVGFGGWTSVVAVLEVSQGGELTSETVAIYVNGVSKNAELHMRNTEARERTTWGSAELYPSDACYIGFESHQGNEVHQSLPLFGAVDELLIYGRAWTVEEVEAFSSRPTGIPSS